VENSRAVPRSRWVAVRDGPAHHRQPRLEPKGADCRTSGGPRVLLGRPFDASGAATVTCDQCTVPAGWALFFPLCNSARSRSLSSSQDETITQTQRSTRRSPSSSRPEPPRSLTDDRRAELLHHVPGLDCGADCSSVPTESDRRLSSGLHLERAHVISNARPSVPEYEARFGAEGLS
jgi:hypothetical protein